jgi:hypothetical protein
VVISHGAGDADWVREMADLEMRYNRQPMK